MPSITVPDYAGGSLPNLVAELETRLTGSSPFGRLHTAFLGEIPDASNYLIFLYDGMGSLQMYHPSAAPLREALHSSID